MITELHQEIVSIMNELKGDQEGQPFNEVYAYPVAIADTFPFAMIDIHTGNSQEDQSSNKKLLKVAFIVRCCFRQENSEDATAERLEAMDLVLEKFTEEGIADYLNGKSIKTDISFETFAIDDHQPIFGFDLILNCQVLMEVS